MEVLKKFLDKKDESLERERQWLLEVRAHCVLSDAAFLGWCAWDVVMLIPPGANGPNDVASPRAQPACLLS